MDATVPYGTTPSERQTMARALAMLFLTGAGVTLISVLIGIADDGNAAVLLVLSVLGLSSVAVLLALGSRLTVVAMHAAVLMGGLLIGAVVLYGGKGGAVYAPMYVWIAVFCGFFFSRRSGLIQIAMTSLILVGVLVIGNGVPQATALVVVTAGSTIVCGLLTAVLVAAVRRQTADLERVSAMAGGLSDVADLAQATCAGVLDALKADVVIMLEPAPDGGGLTVTAMAGSPEAGMVFSGQRARDALQAGYRDGEVALIHTDEPARGLRRFDGDVLGIVQPVLRETDAIAVLAVGWTARRRALPERTRQVTLLFAAEASVALDRAERERKSRERAALEINDNIVQGLVVAKYALQRGKSDAAVDALDETLAAARKLITDQLEQVSGHEIRPGSMARRAEESFAPGSLRL